MITENDVQKAARASAIKSLSSIDVFSELLPALDSEYHYIIAEIIGAYAAMGYAIGCQQTVKAFSKAADSLGGDGFGSVSELDGDIKNDPNDWFNFTHYC